MKYKFVALCLLTLSIAGCKSKQAFEYSERIVAMEKSLTPDVVKTEQDVADFFSKFQYDSAAEASRRMENIIEEKIESIRTTRAPDVKEADNFKKAAIRYFSYLKSIYTIYREYAEEVDGENSEKIRQRLLGIEKSKADAIAEMQKAQQKFAKANGFKVQ